jgi:hypothetical protein
MLPVNGSFLGALQLRLDRGASGRVLVEVDEVPVWQKAVNGLPERRVLVPLSDIRLPANAASIRVALQPDGAA